MCAAVVYNLLSAMATESTVRAPIHAPTPRAPTHGGQTLFLQTSAAPHWSTILCSQDPYEAFRDLVPRWIEAIQATGCIAADAGGSKHAADTTAVVLERCGMLRALCIEVGDPTWDLKARGLKEIGVAHGHTHPLYRLIQYCIVKSVAGAGSKGGGYKKKLAKDEPKGTTKERIGKVLDLDLFTPWKTGTPIFTGIKVRCSLVRRQRTRLSSCHTDLTLLAVGSGLMAAPPRPSSAKSPQTRSGLVPAR